MTTPTTPCCCGVRSPAGVTGHAVRLCRRVSPSLRDVKTILAAPGTVGQPGGHRRVGPALWRVAGQNGHALDILVRSRRNTKAAGR